MEATSKPQMEATSKENDDVIHPDGGFGNNLKGQTEKKSSQKLIGYPVVLAVVFCSLATGYWVYSYHVNIEQLQEDKTELKNTLSLCLQKLGENTGNKIRQTEESLKEQLDQIKKEKESIEKQLKQNLEDFQKTTIEKNRLEVKVNKKEAEMISLQKDCDELKKTKEQLETSNRDKDAEINLLTVKLNSNSNHCHHSHPPHDHHPHPPPHRHHPHFHHDHHPHPPRGHHPHPHGHHPHHH